MPERDPAAVQALNDQIMVDPDLAGQNEANAALTGGIDHSIPPIVSTREAIENAKQEAADLVGGLSNMQPLPDPTINAEPIPETGRIAVGEMARLLKEAEPCADGVSYTAQWAASVPQALPIYPRGNTIEAAGNTGGECAMRAIRFLSPVSREDIFAFYATRARDAGIGNEFSERGEYLVLKGSKGGKAFAVFARKRSSGISEVSLILAGF